ncbi:helix-turn-helix domain-containing protein [Actinoplanes sp. NPDC026619]|uniref:helix-turn-helix domain-containing protein n=1 Tax=Actinoplanes sp. NPDC026619 TaxID=3155798 RepID=UPI00340C0258
MEVRRVPVASLRLADSPRAAGENVEHTKMLAKIEEGLPPIIVHRPTMRVIDGTHRLAAARLRGDETIEVQLFDGTEQEAFVLAVQTNIAHGLPLSLADRSRAAERIIASHPTWSDRAIASAAGIGARTVGNIRQRLGADAQTEEVQARTGRDGRVRPVDIAAGRLKASALIRERPDASLREIARAVGVSPSTVRDVRRRVEAGEDPVPEVRRRGGDARTRDSGADGLPDGPEVEALLQGLRSDPSLRFTDTGRTVLRWISSRAVRSDERMYVAGNVPPHCAYIIANVARACAEEWMQLANDLEQRSVDSA